MNFYPKSIVEQRIETFTSQMGYNYVKMNGKRIINSRMNKTNLNGCEIYIGKIPKFINEIELFSLFNHFGSIYELRMMYDYNNLHRGFAFITYFNACSAKEALKLNNYEIRNGLNLYVAKSINNCSLYFGKIPNNINVDQFRYEISKYVSGIRNVFLPRDIKNEKLNRGYAFINFENHKSAAIAKKLFSFDSLRINGSHISVDWSDPILEVDPEIMNQVTRLYLYNLAIECTSEDVRTHVSHLIPFANTIKKVCKIRDFCFVHFSKRIYAEKALNLIKGTYLLNKPIFVEWARPQLYNKKETLMQINQCYSSLPSKLKKEIKHLHDLREDSSAKQHIIKGY